MATDETTNRAVTLDGERLEEAGRIYRSIGFAPSGADDTTFGVLEDGALIALGRINRYDDGALEIGGFWTRPDRRGRGIARRLVENVLEALPSDRDCYCVPFDHLVGFYESFGMTEVAEHETVPPSIEAKRAFCRQQVCAGRYQETTLLRVRQR